MKMFNETHSQEGSLKKARTIQNRQHPSKGLDDRCWQKLSANDRRITRRKGQPPSEDGTDRLDVCIAHRFSRCFSTPEVSTAVMRLQTQIEDSARTAIFEHSLPSGPGSIATGARLGGARPVHLPAALRGPPRRSLFFCSMLPVVNQRTSERERLRKLLRDEKGTIRKEAPQKIALCYPSSYHLGMSSLGFQTIYREINQRRGSCAERAFLPEEDATDVLTLESQSPLSHFAVAAFSIAYELELTGFFRVLELSGIPLLREDR